MSGKKTRTRNDWLDVAHRADVKAELDNWNREKTGMRHAAHEASRMTLSSRKAVPLAS